MTAPALATAAIPRAIFDENGDAMLLVDPESDLVLDANKTACRLTGFTRAELVGTRSADLFRFDRPGGDAHKLRAAAGKTTQFHGQDGYFLRTKSDPGWLPASLTVTRLHGGEKTLALITARDDTDRRAALLAAKQSEERFRALVEKSSDGVILLDASGLVRYASPTAARLVGSTPAGMLGGDAFALVHPDDRPRMRHLFARALARPGEETAVRFRGYKSNGTWGPTDLVAVNRLDDPCVRGIVVNYRDMTRQLQAEEELTRQHALLRTLIDAIPDVVCFKGRELKFVDGNPAFERLAGCPISEVAGRRCDEVFHAPWADALREIEERVFATGRPERVEAWIDFPDGRPRLLDIMVAPAGPNWLTVVGRDLTDRKALEDQVRQSQKMDAIGQLAGGVAHDFNNLLTVILGNVELGREATRGTPLEELFAATDRAARRAAELTGQLLGFARRQPLAVGPVDLNAVAHEAAGLFRRTFDPRVRVVEQPRPHLWRTRADAGQVHQVLMNLGLNARDAMPAGGALTLTTGNVNLDPTAAGPRRFVRLRVADTGTGMTPEVKARVFEPFFTTKETGQGTGLGLAVVFGIVQAHGGWIECDSTPGGGTTFEVYFPADETTVEEIPATPFRIPSPLGRGERVLFADDEPMIRQLAQSILGPLGYNVVLAADGAEAVDRFRETAADLVILDLTMPNLTGKEALARIRELAPAVPVIVASGYSVDRADLNGTGATFLDKPFTPAGLAAAVRDALDGRGP